MIKSFKPGQTEKERYKTQDESAFYKTQFPTSLQNTRVNSFSSRVAYTTSQLATNGTASLPKGSSLQATFKEMKDEVNQEKCMFNYNIKTTHMYDMTCFLASKHFELNIKKPTMPSEPLKPGIKAEAPAPPKPTMKNDKKNEQEVSDSRMSYLEEEALKRKEEAMQNFVCSEDIEKDPIEIAR